jgi:hypothetical protein
LLVRKFGYRSQGVLKAIEDLERNPSSSDLRTALQKEVRNAGADRDRDLLNAATVLHQQVFHVHQTVPGNRGAVAGRDAYNFNGRPGLIVLLAIVLVAIFSFLIWQLVTSVNQANSPKPTPTPTPMTATPEGTLTSFCSLARAGGSDYAYANLFTDNFKQQNTASEFQQQWSFYTRPVTACTPTITNSSDTTATATLAVTAMVVSTSPGNGQQNETYDVTLVKDSQGQWKIDRMEKA